MITKREKVINEITINFRPSEIYGDNEFSNLKFGRKLFKSMPTSGKNTAHFG